MSIVSESITVIPHGDLVEIRYSSVVKDAGGIHDANGSLWIERASLGWLRNALENAIADPRADATVVTRGSDNLRVLVGGHEAEPYVNVFNKRVGDVVHPGTYWIAASPASATRLVEEIKIIAA
jgi:hypothetical protein